MYLGWLGFVVSTEFWQNRFCQAERAFEEEPLSDEFSSTDYSGRHLSDLLFGQRYQDTTTGDSVRDTIGFR